MARIKKKARRKTPTHPLNEVHIMGEGGGDDIIQALFEACGYHVVTHYPTAKKTKKNKTK
jgi:hypothetical protein